MSSLLTGALLKDQCFHYIFRLSNSGKFVNFPVPKSAELVDKKGSFKSYNWSKASEENGILFGYEMVLKVSEGASVIYTKGKLNSFN